MLLFLNCLFCEKWAAVVWGKAAQRANMRQLSGVCFVCSWAPDTVLPASFISPDIPCLAACCCACTPLRPCLPPSLQVRLLCRKQFLARALGLKVAAAQRQQPQPRSSGSSGAACMLTHGDTWSHR